MVESKGVGWGGADAVIAGQLLRNHQYIAISKKHYTVDQNHGKQCF